MMSPVDYIVHQGRNISVRRKLLLTMLATVSAALLLASAVAIVFDRQAAKNNLQEEINVLTGVIAHRSTAALTFGDTQLATENLDTLKEKSTVVAACIYDNFGILFARFNNAGGEDKFCRQTMETPNLGYTDQYFVGYHDIRLDDTVIGSLLVKVSLRKLNQRQTNYVVTVVVIFLAVGILAFLLAAKLQKVITRPIDELARASGIISKDRDYSIRVRQTTDDEIGRLVSAFNVMLEGIEQRDAALVDAKENLEEVVKERTRELQEAQNELVRSERMATLGQLTATVSHELRNPLGTIRTSVFTLANRIGTQDAGLKKNIQRIERNIVRCDNIITELLDFSRIRALQHEKTNLSTWLTTIVNELDMPGSIELRMELDKAIDIEIDRDLLRRVIVNVIENACQAIEEIEDEGQDRTVIVQSNVTAERTEIIFIDTGPGIDEEVLPHIFEPLYSTKSFGIGLGLPVVKQVMEQHGGGVEVSSEKGVGTRLVLWLPSSLTYTRQIAL